MSQYTEQYLDACAVEPITIGTFLTQNLRGKAKIYSSSYYATLQRSLMILHSKGLAEPCASIKGGVAWKRTFRGRVKSMVDAL